MKYLKMLGLAAFAAMAFTAFVGAGTASATTLEITGAKQTGKVAITSSIKTGTSAVLRDTFGFSANTCTESHVAGETETNLTTVPTGKITTLTFGGCEHKVTVEDPGKLYVEWISGTTNGRVFSEEAKVETYSTIHGTYITCNTGTGTAIGTITGVLHGQATMDINATLTCGPHLHSAKWTGTYVVTSPSDLGVTT